LHQSKGALGALQSHPLITGLQKDLSFAIRGVARAAPSPYVARLPLPGTRP
jgi:hypothetical protein